MIFTGILTFTIKTVQVALIRDYHAKEIGQLFSEDECLKSIR
jgi:hypothetical protein